MNAADNVTPIQGEQTEHGFIAPRFLPNAEGQEKHEVLQAKRPWFFNALGELKNKYKNRTCICGSELKIKNCCGIKYL